MNYRYAIDGIRDDTSQAFRACRNGVITREALAAELRKNAGKLEQLRPDNEATLFTDEDQIHVYID